MTMDDESSIYVGGLPYDADEQTIRSVFSLYGAIIDVKGFNQIINDLRTRGKCYCFVTFTNPRSAVDAINEMNGGTIGGRFVKVNGVRTRGGRSNFGRERFHQSDERNGDWDRSRDRDRDRGYDYDRDGHRNRDDMYARERDRSQDPDQDRDRRFEHMRDHDQAREPWIDKDWSQEDGRIENEQDNGRVHNDDVDRDQSLDLNTDRSIDRTSDPDRSSDKYRKEQPRRNYDLNVTNQHSMDLSSDSHDNYDDQVEDELEQSTHRLDQLKKEVLQMEAKLDEKKILVNDLEKKSRKLEEALINAKKHSSYRQMQLTNLHKCFLQVKDCMERLKTSEKELQDLVDAATLEKDPDGVGLKYGQLTNGTLEGR